MKIFLSIFVCKILKIIGALIGKGSSLPGKVALKIDPNILRKVKLCENIIAVTGSNGKTTTTELITDALQKNGINSVCNKEGSNQIEGIVTLILSNCNLKGVFKKEVLVLESDERFSKLTFKYFTPKYYVITNILRDQMTRNRHPEWICDIIRQSIHPTSKLILNTNDPLVSLIGKNFENIIYYSINKNEFFCEIDYIYDDGYFCPNCKYPLKYEYRCFGSTGMFNCTNCGLKSNESKFNITNINKENNNITINNKYQITLNSISIHNIYNVLSAFSVCACFEIDKNKIAKSLCEHVSKSGRIVNLNFSTYKVSLFVSKHENPTSYNNSINQVIMAKEICSVLIVINKISRKYFTSETSWLWDISFEKLKNENVKRIFLVGTYCYDLATRFKFTTIDDKVIFCEKSIKKTVKLLKKEIIGKLFIITCFSDKDDLLKILMNE